MAVVRVLPANSESAVVDSHEEWDLPVLAMSLMMSESVSKVPDVLMTVGGRQDWSADVMARQLDCLCTKRSKLTKVV